MSYYDLETKEIVLTDKSETIQKHEEGHKKFHEETLIGKLFTECILTFTVPLILAHILFESNIPLFQTIAGLLLLMVIISEAVAWGYCLL